MPHFKRYYVPNAIMFITSVIYERQPLFGNDTNTTLLFDTMRQVQASHPFHLLAYVVMPDHVHFLMKVKPGANFSQVMQSIKWNFTYNYKHLHGITSALTLWQQRFWDHIIRDEDDLARHIDYVHYNPVKHGFTTSPGQWKHSTFSYWVERGYTRLSGELRRRPPLQTWTWSS